MLSKYTDKEIKFLLESSSSFWDFCKKLGYTNKNGNTYSYIKRELKLRNIDTDNYRRVQRNIGRTKKKTDEEIFSPNSSYDRKDLKKKLIKENLLEYKCSECSINSWMNKPLSLQLDHINGINNDNRLFNLRFLCPNCHTQTDTWGTKNKKTQN